MIYTKAKRVNFLLGPFALLAAVIGSTSSFAAESDGSSPNDANRLNPAQQVQVTLITDELKRVDLELQVLQSEAVKTTSTLYSLSQLKLDEPRLHRLFQKLNENISILAQQTNGGGRMDPSKIAVVQQSLRELQNLVSLTLPQFPVPPSDQKLAVVLEIYADDGIRYTSKVPFDQLFALLKVPSVEERTIADQVKSLQITLQSVTGESVVTDTEAFKDALRTAWSAVQTRIESARKVREARKEELLKTLDELGASQQATDRWLIYAIIGMIIALFLIFLSAIIFAKAEIQRLIFGGRLLVELVGMAFLLLTIIILGTGAKIDRAVLGTLLGTVGGYIFGQQLRRTSQEDSPSKPEQSGEVVQQLENTALLLQRAQATVAGDSATEQSLKEAIQALEKAQAIAAERV